MFQKRNDLEVLEQLRKNPSHIRKLSQTLTLVPSTTMRILRTLEEQNVVDSTTEGKNKVYALKESIEARTYLLLTEHYKLLKLIAQGPEIRRIVKALQTTTSADLIVLFGSYAKNTQTAKSDIDLYIETAQRQDFSSISEKIRIQRGNLDNENPLTQEIIKNHVIIRGVERFFMIAR